MHKLLKQNIRKEQAGEKQRVGEYSQCLFSYLGLTD